MVLIQKSYSLFTAWLLFLRLSSLKIEKFKLFHLPLILLIHQAFYKLQIIISTVILVYSVWWERCSKTSHLLMRVLSSKHPIATTQLQHRSYTGTNWFWVKLALTCQSRSPQLWSGSNLLSIILPMLWSCRRWTPTLWSYVYRTVVKHNISVYVAIFESVTAPTTVLWLTLNIHSQLSPGPQFSVAILFLTLPNWTKRWNYRKHRQTFKNYTRRT